MGALSGIKKFIQIVFNFPIYFEYHNGSTDYHKNIILSRLVMLYLQKKDGATSI